jgi:tRNA(Arg) A34 adenosine deaminase TadA
MMLTKTDKMCLDLAISEAQKSFDLGCYPVGAVLYIDETKIYSTGNTSLRKNSLVFHAENSLIMKYGEEMYEQFKHGGSIKIYSTLEPCLMCLGAAVKNKATDIYYIQKDPHGGACGMSVDGLGISYKEIWPNINQISYSNIPYELLMKFFENEVAHGSRWGENMLKLFKDLPQI